MYKRGLMQRYYAIFITIIPFIYGCSPETKAMQSAQAAQNNIIANRIPIVREENTSGNQNDDPKNKITLSDNTPDEVEVPDHLRNMVNGHARGGNDTKTKDEPVLVVSRENDSLEGIISEEDNEQDLARIKRRLNHSLNIYNTRVNEYIPEFQIFINQIKNYKKNVYDDSIYADETAETAALEKFVNWVGSKQARFPGDDDLSTAKVKLGLVEKLRQIVQLISKPHLDRVSQALQVYLDVARESYILSKTEEDLLSQLDRMSYEDIDSLYSIIDARNEDMKSLFPQQGYSHTMGGMLNYLKSLNFTPPEFSLG